ncbi:MAG: deoxyribose-phosphate aldolase [Spirochaetaceae bacterium]|nr:deoxyribose-phosphate aldolase [Spirochaetaceae bacterium]
MKDEEILSHIDHTLLKAVTGWPEIQKLCEEALRYHTASVCVPPSYVKRIREHFPALNICTVIGFPLGYNTTAVKVAEAVRAVEDGAGEIDMVINLGDVKNGDFDKVTTEIRQVRKAINDRILKVIIETCYLTEAEKTGLCESVTAGGADYIKTSTGFGTAGAKIEDIRLFKRHIGPKVKIKAAGGVKTREDLELFLGEGCDRIGTSSAVTLLAGGSAGAY